MDAYSSYIVQLSEARTAELRREAAGWATARAARGPRPSVWARARARLRGRPAPTRAPVSMISTVSPVCLPNPTEQEVRRSA